MHHNFERYNSLKAFLTYFTSSNLWNKHSSNFLFLKKNTNIFEKYKNMTILTTQKFWLTYCLKHLWSIITKTSSLAHKKKTDRKIKNSNQHMNKVTNKKAKSWIKNWTEKSHKNRTNKDKLEIKSNKRAKGRKSNRNI